MPWNRRAVLWADEGVYRMTKEIQLVKPGQFLIFTLHN